MQKQVVIITGGSSGIGQACAELWASRGFDVVITGRAIERLYPVTDELKKLGAEVLALEADVADIDACQMVINKTIERFGRIDVLINNAGVSMRSLFEELDLQVFRQVMEANFYGAVYMTKFALPHIIKNQGKVIAISSINGYRGTPARTAYTASKYAMQGFFEALRTEMKSKNVHILVVAPGFTRSKIREKALTGDGKSQGESPMDESKMMSAEEVALAIWKALANNKRDLVLTSFGRLVVFLNKWVPGWMDKKVIQHFVREKGSPLKEVEA